MVGLEGWVHWEAGRTGQSLSKLTDKDSRGGDDTKARGVEASDLDNPNSKAEPKKGGFQVIFQHSVREKSRSHKDHAWGVDKAVGRVIIKEPLGKRQLVRATSQK